jgi:hypothetical protein
MSKKKSRWTVADARAALSELAASGLSVRAFARSEGLDEERLYRWRRRFSAETVPQAIALTSATPALIEIRSSPQRRTEPVEIVLTSGVTLRVAEAIDPAALTRLVAALR